jgi:hypothetical protein
MDYSGLITIGAALLGGKKSPSIPSAAPLQSTPMTTKSLSEYLPQIDAMMGLESQNALSMMRGELPQSVIDQVKMFAGENAMRGGYGASTTRTGNMVARDLGLTALDMMESGTQYANYLMNQAQSMQTYDAKMTYQAWAANAEQQWNQFQIKADRRANIFEGLLKGATQLSTSAYITKKEEKKAAQEALDKIANSSKTRSVTFSIKNS